MFCCLTLLKMSNTICKECKEYYALHLQCCSVCYKGHNGTDEDLHSFRAKLKFNAKKIVSELVKKRYLTYFDEYVKEMNFPHIIPSKTLFKHTLLSCVDQTPDMVFAILNGLTEDNTHPLVLTSEQASELYEQLLNEQTERTKVTSKTTNYDAFMMHNCESWRFDHVIGPKIIDFWNIPKHHGSVYMCYYPRKHGYLTSNTLINEWNNFNCYRGIGWNKNDDTIVNTCNICYDNVMLKDIAKCFWCSFVCHKKCHKETNKCPQCRREIKFKLVNNYYII